ncbi:MAG: hypothetical protein WBG95_12500 [Sulfitobacter sp.]
MKKGIGIFLVIIATPAFAHHEVVVVTSMVPLASTIAGLSVAAFIAWHRGRKK